jgi:hypothetical protein
MNQILRGDEDVLPRILKGRFDRVALALGEMRRIVSEYLRGAAYLDGDGAKGRLVRVTAEPVGQCLRSHGQPSVLGEAPDGVDAVVHPSPLSADLLPGDSRDHVGREPRPLRRGLDDLLGVLVESSVPVPERSRRTFGMAR